MARRSDQSRFVLCVENGDYEASLQVRKIYQTIRDQRAAAHQYVRVIDESGEDYLYPRAYFVPILVPRAAAKAFSAGS